MCYIYVCVVCMWCGHLHTYREMGWDGGVEEEHVQDSETAQLVHIIGNYTNIDQKIIQGVSENISQFALAVKLTF